MSTFSASTKTPTTTPNSAHLASPQPYDASLPLTLPGALSQNSHPIFLYNYAAGIPDGMSFIVKAMQLAIEKFIDAPQRTNQSPTRAAVFFNLTNQFNSVSRSEFFNVIAEHFPKLLPLTTLFYSNANTVHHKWSGGTWRQLLMEEGVTQGCPLSPLFASFMVACLLEPIDALLHA